MEETLKLEVFVENNGIYYTLYPSRALLKEKKKKKTGPLNTMKKRKLFYLIVFDAISMKINLKIISVTLK